MMRWQQVWRLLICALVLCGSVLAQPASRYKPWEKPRIRSQMKTIITIAVDDNLRHLADSMAVFSEARKYTSGDQFIGTLFVIAEHPLHGDTTSGADNEHLSISEMNAFYNAGWEIGSHCYRNEGIFSNPGGWFYTGKFPDANGDGFPDTLYSEITMAVRALTDTMHYSNPSDGDVLIRGFSYPSASSDNAFMQLVSMHHDYATSSRQMLDVGANPRHNYPYYIWNQEGAWAQVSAYPGHLPNRYEIPNVLGPSDWPSTFRDRVLNALRFKGSWIVWVMHYLPGEMPDGDIGLRTRLNFLDSLISVGAPLEVMPMDQAFDLYFNTPVSPGANMLHNNFEDWDLDGVPDFFTTVASQRVCTFYPDSTMESGATHHGFGAGEGYLICNFSGAVGRVDAGEALTSGKAKLVMKAPTWGMPGDRIAVEVYAQIDDAVYTGFTGGDSLWVSFAQYWDPAYGVAWANGERTGGDTSIPYGFVSIDESTGDGDRGNSAIFAASDDISGGTWCKLRAETVIGAVGEVYIVIGYGDGIPANAVKIAPPHGMLLQSRHGR